MEMTGKFSSILVGDDGSTEAEHAVQVAFSMARCWGAKVVLLCVLAPPSAEQQAEGFGLEDKSEAEAALQARVEQAVQTGIQDGIAVVSVLVEGDPEQEIERFVAEHGVDLLVVGHREISRPRRWIEGSTSQELARKLKVSILVVHSGDPME